MRIVFFGSHPFATPVLRSVLASRHTVVALVTPPDRPRGRGRRVQVSPLAELARENEVTVIQPPSAKDPELVRELSAFEPDALLVASYGEILREPILDLAPRGAYNVHASLLPRWRGASPVQRAILAGDAKTGVTIQRMVLALDAGDVVLGEETPIGEDETAAELLLRLAVLGGAAAVQALDRIESGEAVLTPQDESLVTLAKKLKKEDGSVDWSRPAAVIARQVRALQPWPGTRTTLPGGAELSLLRVRAEPEVEAAAPGTLLGGSGELRVATGDGVLAVLEVKPSGRGAMDGAAFLRGARLEEGAVLGE